AAPGTKSNGLPPPPGGCVGRAARLVVEVDVDVGSKVDVGDNVDIGGNVDVDVDDELVVEASCAVDVGCCCVEVDVASVVVLEVDGLTSWLLVVVLELVLVLVIVIEVVKVLVASSVVVVDVAGGVSGGIRVKLCGGGRLTVDTGCVFAHKALTRLPSSAWFNSDFDPALTKTQDSWILTCTLVMASWHFEEQELPLRKFSAEQPCIGVLYANTHPNGTDSDAID
ncbi:hypothetical protein QQS21_012866, partial [Conoideocrella luteorostrata]